jgi:regulator of sigma E protease
MLSMFQGLGQWAPLGLPAFLFVITVVIFFHELGHFLVARACGVKVETFSIGFGSKIFGWTDRHGTHWKVSWIPLGGYVKFLGDMDAASKPDRAKLDELPAEERKQIFAFKPLYQRALVVAAGPVANFLLAILIFAATFMISGRDLVAPVVDHVQAGSAAAAAGLQKGDVIRSINGEKITSFSDMQRIVSVSAGQDLTVIFVRNGQQHAVHATPKMTVLTDRFGGTEKLGALGIANYLGKGEITHVTYNPITALAAAWDQTWDIVGTTFSYLWQMVAGYQSADQLSGPIGIAKISGQVAQIGFMALINLAALISVSIGLVNLFPIPILDGGHLLYYACETVLGRPLGERAQDVGFRLGLAVVLGLMLLATWNDLSRLNLF